MVEWRLADGGVAIVSNRNRVERLINEIAAEREVPQWRALRRAGPLVPPRTPEGPKGWAAVAGCGVYALGWRGKVVWIGKARKVIEALCEHRNWRPVPRWWPIPAIEFDRAVVWPSHPDRIENDYQRLQRAADGRMLR
jgi:hypothetical protein